MIKESQNFQKEKTMNNTQNIKTAVLGAGSWGTTLALVLHGNGHNVTLWEFRPDVALEIDRRREVYEFVPGVTLPEDLKVTSDLEKTVSGKDLVLIVVPSHVLRSAISRAPGEIIGDAVVVTATKGVEAGTSLRMSEVIADQWKIDMNRIAALSGPSLSKEVLNGIPTTVVSASQDLNTAKWVQEIFAAPLFRVYASEDIVGVELGGALKNVIAIAAGIADGLGFGDNAKGALLTRGLSEISRLAMRMGGSPQTLSGLSGMGDLITTCVSTLSRNHTVGYRIGQGEKLKDILDSMHMIAEGANTTRAAIELAKKYNFEMPIVEAVRQILFEDKPPKQAVVELMTRELKVED